jgi:protoheme IX farnesyltransferase
MRPAESVVAARRTGWRHYLELTKPRVVSLIGFTAAVGMLLSVEQSEVSWVRFAAGLAGILLAAMAGAVFNHAAESHLDVLMERTRNRPLPTGRVGQRQALAFGTLLSLLSTIVLVAWTNLLTAILTLAAMVGYAAVYTLYLKRRTPQNIVWGGAAGAAPPLLGWVAMTGEAGIGAWLLFSIIFIWTPPHFWALAIQRRREYAKAGLPMLPVTHGVEFTRWQVLGYTFMLLSVSLLPFALGWRGPFYLAGAVALGIGFIIQALRLFGKPADGRALSTFTYSIIYLAMLFLFLLTDHWVQKLMG